MIECFRLFMEDFLFLAHKTKEIWLLEDNSTDTSGENFKIS